MNKETVPGFLPDEEAVCTRKRVVRSLGENSLSFLQAPRSQPGNKACAAFRVQGLNSCQLVKGEEPGPCLKASSTQLRPPSLQQLPQKRVVCTDNAVSTRGRDISEKRQKPFDGAAPNPHEFDGANEVRLSNEAPSHYCLPRKDSSSSTTTRHPVCKRQMKLEEIIRFKRRPDSEGRILSAVKSEAEGTQDSSLAEEESSSSSERRSFPSSSVSSSTVALRPYYNEEAADGWAMACSLLADCLSDERKRGSSSFFSAVDLLAALLEVLQRRREEQAIARARALLGPTAISQHSSETAISSEVAPREVEAQNFDLERFAFKKDASSHLGRTDTSIKDEKAALLGCVKEEKSAGSLPSSSVCTAKKEDGVKHEDKAVSSETLGADSLLAISTLSSDATKCVLEIEGLSVCFPHATPLFPQLQVIRSVISACKKRRHALLESPTGTGKTAALLSAVLSWQRWRRLQGGSTKPPMVLYLTRTHKQAAQVVAEVKRSPYKPRVVHLASREFLCAFAYPKLLTRSQPSSRLASVKRETDEAKLQGRGAAVSTVECRASARRIEGLRRTLFLERRSKIEYSEAPSNEVLKKELGSDFHEEERVSAPWLKRSRSNSSFSLAKGSNGEALSSLPSSSDSLSGMSLLEAQHREVVKAAEAAALPPTSAFSSVKGSVSSTSSSVWMCPYYARLADPAFAVELVAKTLPPLSVVKANQYAAKKETLPPEAKGEKEEETKVKGREENECYSIKTEASEWVPADVEDLAVAALGAKNGGACPYYASHALTQEAELVVCPYNFVIDPGVARRTKLADVIQGSVLIFDEAHNVEDSCRDVGTVSVSGEQLRLTLEWLRSIDALRFKDETQLKADKTDFRQRQQVERLSFRAQRLSVHLSALLFAAVDAASPLALGLAVRKQGEELWKQLRRSSTEGRTFFRRGSGPAFGSSRSGLGEEEEEEEEVGVEVELRSWALASSGKASGVTGLLELAGLASEEAASAAMEAVEFLSQQIGELNEILPSSTIDLQNLEQLVWCLSLAARHPLCYTAAFSFRIDAAFLEELNSKQANSDLASEEAEAERRKRLSDAVASAAFADRLRNEEGSDALLDHETLKRLSIHLCLQTAAAVFGRLSEAANSIILTSGTLAPLDSFTSELGDSFARRLMKPPLQASHVIDASQLRIACLASLPVERGGALPHEEASSVEELARPEACWSERRLCILRRQQLRLASEPRMPLDCRAFNLASPSFLAALGRCVARLLQTLPGGVLLFLPSYGALRRAERVWKQAPFAPTTTPPRSSRQTARNLPVWRGSSKKSHEEATSSETAGVASVEAGASIWKAFLAVKSAVFCEGRDSQGLEDLQRSFSRTVSEKGGALVLAVFRGRLSEGLSFNDDLCRAVLCVGLPFPALKDSRVQNKRAFNDAVKALGLSPTQLLLRPCKEEQKSKEDPATGSGDTWISGSRWYSLQAFRALNQGIGRCIRHLGDFGAVILLECRLAKGSADLCQWFAPHFTTASELGALMLGLHDHFKDAPIAASRAIQASQEAARRSCVLSHSVCETPAVKVLAESPIEAKEKPPLKAEAEADTEEVRRQRREETHQPFSFSTPSASGLPIDRQLCETDEEDLLAVFD